MLKIAASTCALLMAFGGLTGGIVPMKAEMITPDAIPQTPISDNIEQRLQGRWQFEQNGETVTLIFAPENQVIFLLPSREETAIAVKMMYDIDPSREPMHLDLIANPDEIALTVFEITEEGQLHLNLNITPGDERPEELSAGDVMLTRVSEDTAIPEDIPIVNLDTPANTAPPVPIQFITILLQGQQAYYYENGSFAENVSELGFATVLETEDYYYEMTRDREGNSRVTIAAMPKTSDSISYAGAIFAIETNGERGAIAGICQSEEPSQSPPVPQISAQNGREIQCPSGASLIQ
ncbi:MAG: type IV pilin-like G/H family protein [Spirulinaceae cyanobacterium]